MSLTAAGLGIPGLPLAKVPGHVNVQSAAELESNVAAVTVDQIVQGLTSNLAESKRNPEPRPRDTVFEGTFEEVNVAFLNNEWGDGLPVIPPTIEKVERFLAFTDRQPEEVIGTLLPDRRRATIWSIAVNGVMSGCRPEYMPVLIAMVEVLADPRFGQEHLGQTPGNEVMITLNGPIIKELDFNYEQGALRVGYRANTSIGRFWRLYLRNVAGFLPHKTDKATFGGTWRVVLAENEDVVARIGWKPMSVDQGFQPGENVVTISSCTCTDSVTAAGADSAEKILRKLSLRVLDIQLYQFFSTLFGPAVRPQVLLSPCIAEAIAKGGYSKEEVKRYLYEHTFFQARRFEELQRPGQPTLCEAVNTGRLPKQYCESADPQRLVPLVGSPDDFLITVSGDPAKDNCFICAQNGRIAYPVSKKVNLPANWDELFRRARKR